MGQRIRVLIADDHPASRKGLRALLRTCPTVGVVCEAKDGREAVQQVEKCRPDVVLMDIRMPLYDGLEATRSIKARWPEVKVIAITLHATYQSAAISAGADDFLLKGCPSNELFAAIQGDRETPKPESPVVGAQSDASVRKEAKHRSNRLAANTLID